MTSRTYTCLIFFCTTIWMRRQRKLASVTWFSLHPGFLRAKWSQIVQGSTRKFPWLLRDLRECWKKQTLLDPYLVDGQAISKDRFLTQYNAEIRTKPQGALRQERTLDNLLKVAIMVFYQSSRGTQQQSKSITGRADTWWRHSYSETPEDLLCFLYIRHTGKDDRKGPQGHVQSVEDIIGCLPWWPRTPGSGISNRPPTWRSQGSPWIRSLSKNLREEQKHKFPSFHRKVPLSALWSRFGPLSFHA